MATSEPDPQEVLDGVIVKQTTNGQPYELDFDADDYLRMTATSDPSDQQYVRPGTLLTWLKQGEYYLPNANGDIQDALRTLRDEYGAEGGDA